MTKYVAYLRVSTEKQGRSGLGLEAQREIILHNVGDAEIIEWFTEVKSGKNIDALPELDKAKKLAKEKKAVLVLAKTDRLRNTQQALDLVDEMKPGGVFFCNVGRNADKFTLTLFFAFAEKERLEISIRTKAALAIKKANGEKLGRNSHKKPTNPTIIMIEAGAEAMREKALNDKNNIASANKAMVLQSRGMSYAQIAESLNESGCKTMTGGRWYAGTVYRLLKRNMQIA